jgi:phage protein D
MNVRSLKKKIEQLAASADTVKLVPVFIVYLDGTRISAEMESSVKEIEVKSRLDFASSFTLKMSDPGRKWTDHDAFREGTELKIMLGYKDAVEEVITGEITGIMPGYRRNADDELVIKGNTMLHRLDRGRKTRAFANRSDREIVEQIASECGIKAEAGDLAQMNLFEIQRNQTDYEYLKNMALRFNCRIEYNNGVMKFAPFEGGIGDDVILEWGKTLLEFYPEMDSTRLVSRVEVYGWDDKKKKQVCGKANFSDIKTFTGKGVPGNLHASDNFGTLCQVFTDNRIKDPQGAEKRAAALITENSMTYVTAKGKCQGNTKVKPGAMVEMKELGQRFSGGYFVTEVTHSFIAEQGYSTGFICSRNTAGM